MSYRLPCDCCSRCSRRGSRPERSRRRARGVGSSPAIKLIAAALGAPVTEPLGDKAAAFRDELRAALLAQDSSGSYAEASRFGYTMGRRPA